MQRKLSSMFYDNFHERASVFNIIHNCPAFSDLNNQAIFPGSLKVSEDNFSIVFLLPCQSITSKDAHLRRLEIYELKGHVLKAQFDLMVSRQSGERRGYLAAQYLMYVPFLDPAVDGVKVCVTQLF